MKRLPLVVLVLAVFVSAFDNGASTSTTAPTTTTAAATPTQTDPFSGTLAIGGTNVHLFTVTVPGAVNVTLTQAGPPSTITVGIGAGVPDALGGCSLALALQTPAGTSPQIQATVSTAGQYCISVVDVGNLS